jgi:hypothetical protein
MEEEEEEEEGVVVVEWRSLKVACPAFGVGPMK